MKKFEVLILNSKELDRNVKVFIHLPKDYYESKKRYPVLYMHDGQVLFNEMEDLETDYGMMQDYIDSVTKTELILVGIASGKTRSDELVPYQIDRGERGLVGGKSDQYLKFIVETLIPYINTHYNTKSKKEYTGLLGVSLGGACTFYAATYLTEHFSRFASVSSSHYRIHKQLLSTIEKADLSNVLRLYSDVGTEETENENGKKAYINTNKELFDLLESKMDEDRYRFSIIEGSRHEFDDWKIRFPMILEFLFESV